MSQTKARPSSIPSASRWRAMRDTARRWLDPAEQPDVWIQPAVPDLGNRVDALRERRPEQQQTLTVLRGELHRALTDRGPESAIVVRAIEMAEELVQLRRRERADRPASFADALREATAQLSPSEARRIRLRLPTDGMVIACPLRLQLLAELALRLGLERTPESTVDAHLTEEGDGVWLRVRAPRSIRCWPPDAMCRAFARLAEELCDRVDGSVMIEDGLVEIRLERLPAS